MLISNAYVCVISSQLPVGLDDRDGDEAAGLVCSRLGDDQDVNTHSTVPEDVLQICLDGCVC
jgi:hypothetical protein